MIEYWVGFAVVVAVFVPMALAFTSWHESHILKVAWVENSIATLLVGRKVFVSRTNTYCTSRVLMLGCVELIGTEFFVRAMQIPQHSNPTTDPSYGYSF